MSIIAIGIDLAQRIFAIPWREFEAGWTSTGSA